MRAKVLSSTEIATKNTINKNDSYFVDALVNSWMVKNTVFDNDDTSIISSTRDARWDFLKDYFHCIAKDLPANGSTNTIEGGKDGMDEIKNVITTWKERNRQSMKEPCQYYHTHMHLKEILGCYECFHLLQGASLLQTNGWHRNEWEETNYYNNETINTKRATMTLAILFHDAIYDPKSDTMKKIFLTPLLRYCRTRLSGHMTHRTIVFPGRGHHNRCFCGWLLMWSWSAAERVYL